MVEGEKTMKKSFTAGPYRYSRKRHYKKAAGRHRLSYYQEVWNSK